MKVELKDRQQQQKPVKIEVEFTVPTYFPTGEFASDEITSLEDALIDNFGGFISYDSDSVFIYINEEDEEVIYHDESKTFKVAIEKNKEDLFLIKNILLNFGIKLKQSFIYFKNYNNEVEKIEC